MLPPPDPREGAPSHEDLPSGVLTVMFTDIEGSTPRWELDPHDMRIALAFHDDVLVSVIGEHDGRIFKHTGDGVGAVFASPMNAVAAAIEFQQRLQNDAWGSVERLKVRIGLHMGELEPTGRDYFGPVVNRAARVMDVANGDQIVVTSRVAGFLTGVQLQPMGEHQLRGVGTERIEMVIDAGLEHDPRPLRTRVETAVKLPVQAHEIVGRESELSDIQGLFAAHRTVTMVGPGGVGKTRLAIEAGHRLSESFADGVVMCELAPLTDGDAVADAVAQAIGAREQPGMSLLSSIANFVAHRHMLLILDNCEHVAEAVNQLGVALQTASQVHVLATSREPLGLPAEQLFGLLPLDAATAGVELFVSRASERDLSFDPSPADRAIVVQICERLDGIPLGIELAAAWTRVLSPADLLDRLHDRFQVLRGGRAGGRHQTLRDTVQWSYEQLNEAQAQLFDRLSVFASGFSLDAVEAVCVANDGDGVIDSADVLDLLMALVDKSMVMSQRGVGRIRFTMLGTLRQFGQERLDASGHSERFRSRHAAYFGDLATAEARRLISHHEADVWETLDREWPNLRAGFDTMLDTGDFDAAASLLLELSWFAVLSMRYELFTWVEEFFAQVDVEARSDAGSLFGLRALRAYFTIDGHSVEYANRGLELDETDPYGLCRMSLSAVSLNNVHSPADSDTITSAWLDHVTDTTPVIANLWAEGMRAFHICSYDPSPLALVHARKVMSVGRSTDSATALGIGHWALGMARTFESVPAALDEWRAGLDAVQSLGRSHLVYHVIVGLVLHFSVWRGDLAEVTHACLAALREARDLHYLAGTSHLFGVTAIVLCRSGRATNGALLLGAMEANGHLPRPNALRAVAKALGDNADDAKLAGRHLSIDDAAGFAIDQLAELAGAAGSQEGQS